MTFNLYITDSGFALCAKVIGGLSITAEIESEHIQAESPQYNNIVRQLTKLGNTIYECTDLIISDDFSYFIPGSKLAKLRRTAVEMLIQAYTDISRNVQQGNNSMNSVPPSYHHAAMYNIANNKSKQFYAEAGLDDIKPAFEIESNTNVPLMQCRYCLRYTLGFCVKNGGRKPQWREPLFLSLPDGRRFRLDFDCKKCQMNVMAE